MIRGSLTASTASVITNVVRLLNQAPKGAAASAETAAEPAPGLCGVLDAVKKRTKVVNADHYRLTVGRKRKHAPLCSRFHSADFHTVCSLGFRCYSSAVQRGVCRYLPPSTGCWRSFQKMTPSPLAISNTDLALESSRYES